MTYPVTIQFRNLDPSESIEAEVRRRAEKLQSFQDKWQEFKVTIEAPHKHHVKGNHYQVHIDMRLPHKHIVISHDPGDENAHEDLLVTIRDAFRAARRRLVDHVDQSHDYSPRH